MVEKSSGVRCAPAWGEIVEICEGQGEMGWQFGVSVFGYVFGAWRTAYAQLAWMLWDVLTWMSFFVILGWHGKCL
jgi:hypothetical protein